MCGICGIVTENIKMYIDNLNKMIASINHRGPDDKGSHYFDNCALGHTRLSIVDLSTGGQPMISPNFSSGITFNGEIYGYKDIKNSLSNYHFKTQSDTEVILALYVQHDSKMMKYLPGIFSFAIWNDSKKELFCARDRFGEKPFYYAIGSNNEFIFASEIKAIIASGMIKPVLNIDSITHYMKHLYVHPYKTIYTNIHTLPPAHFLIYKNKKVIIERYWHLPDIDDKLNIDECLEKFKFLFEKAVSNQLIADVPVGAFLSGGADSSTIVAVASKYKSKLSTFTFRFGNFINESPFASEVSKLYSTNHIELSEDNVDLAKLLINMQDIYDEPFADSSNIPTFLISKLARQYNKVILTGDGGDELLGGYRGVYTPLLFMQYSKNSQDKSSSIKYNSLTCLFKIIQKILYKCGIDYSSSLKYKLKKSERLLRGLGFNFPFTLKYKLTGKEYARKYNSVLQAHQNEHYYFTTSQIEELGIKVSSQENEWQSENKYNTVDDVLRMDIENSMAGDILVKTDRASMANSLELRAPFLDVDFASFCISLPFNLKISGTMDKIILKKAFSNLWPDSIKNRDKQGFEAPVNDWLKMKSLETLKNKYLNNPAQKIFSLLSFEKSRVYLKYNNYLTWILLILSIWMDKHSFTE